MRPLHVLLSTTLILCGIGLCACGGSAKQQTGPWAVLSETPNVLRLHNDRLYALSTIGFEEVGTPVVLVFNASTGVLQHNVSLVMRSADDGVYKLFGNELTVLPDGDFLVRGSNDSTSAPNPFALINTCVARYSVPSGTVRWKVCSEPTTSLQSPHVGVVVDGLLYSISGFSNVQIIDVTTGTVRASSTLGTPYESAGFQPVAAKAAGSPAYLIVPWLQGTSTYNLSHPLAPRLVRTYAVQSVAQSQKLLVTPDGTRYAHLLDDSFNNDWTFEVTEVQTGARRALRLRPDWLGYGSVGCTNTVAFLTMTTTTEYTHYAYLSVNLTTMEPITQKVLADSTSIDCGMASDHSAVVCVYYYTSAPSGSPGAVVLDAQTGLEIGSYAQVGVDPTKAGELPTFDSMPKNNDIVVAPSAHRPEYLVYAASSVGIVAMSVPRPA